jgi:hypothetical protein
MRTRTNLLAVVVAIVASAMLLALRQEPTWQVGVAAIAAGIGCGLMVALIRDRPLHAFAVLVVLASITGAYFATPIGRFRVEQPAMAVALLTILATRTWPSWRQLRPLVPIAAALAAYLGVMGLSSLLYSADLLLSIRLIGWTILSILCGLVAFALLVRVKAGTEVAWLSRTGYLNAAVGLVVAVWYLLLGPNRIPGMQISFQEIPKMAGLAFEANLYSSALGALAIFAIERFRARPTRISAAGVILVLVGMGLGATRSAYIGLGVGLVGYLGLFAWRYRSRLNLRLVVPLIAVGLVLAPLSSKVLLPIEDHGLIGVMPGAEEGTISGTATDTIVFRADHVAVALADLAQNPIIGLGAATYRQRHVLEGINAGLPDYLGIQALAAVYEGGVIGAGALAIGMLLAVRLVWRGLQRQPTLAIAYLASLTSLIVSYQSTNALFMSLIWIVLAGGMAITLRDPDLTETPETAAAVA